ncbi:hypothetical protein RB594_005387 [Gaeumannomyces avenae]
MGASMSTAVGWAVVISIAGFFAYREWDKNQRRLAHRNPGQKLRDDQRNANQGRRDVKEKEHTKPKRQRVPETPAAAPAATQPKASKETYAAAAKQEQPKATQPKAGSQKTASQKANQKKSAVSHSSDDDEANNREFAKQLASVKQGTKFAAKSKDDVRQKSVKQSRAEEAPKKAGALAPTPEEPKVSAPSSTAGIDADDDQSSAASPVVSAVNAAGDVSDMLEKPAPGPSVLRLTDTEEKNKKSYTPKPAAPVETKKQRQNRKKAEAAKAAREEAEADRKIRFEAQRKTVRLAEGRAAQDGSGFMAAKAQGNAWTGSNKPNGGSNGHLPVQPLDTFDAEKPTEAPAPAAVKPQKQAAASGETWIEALPSEEEQIKMLREEESWSTVKTKARKNKKKADEDSTAESNDEAAPQKKAEAATPVASATPVATAKPVAAKENQRPKTFSQNSSFAALNADGAADLAEEEEWDV